MYSLFKNVFWGSLQRKTLLKALFRNFFKICTLCSIKRTESNSEVKMNFLLHLYIVSGFFLKYSFGTLFLIIVDWIEQRIRKVLFVKFVYCIRFLLKTIFQNFFKIYTLFSIITNWIQQRSRNFLFCYICILHQV